jgi:ABC-2 type transport system ATP-binding protein
MIRLENAVKSFEGKTVLKDVSLEVKQGMIYGLLGPSGAGKTTIINILTDELALDSGIKEVTAKPEEIGIMLDHDGIYEPLTGIENLEFYRDLHDVDESAVTTILKKIGLSDDGEKGFNTMSRGIQQRIALARAIIHNPKLLFLDEPTNALDPRTKRNICRLLLELKEAGSTILVTTHDMDEALKLCDVIGLLHEGQIIETGPPLEICQKYDAVKTVPDLEAVFLQLTGEEL